MTIFSESSVLGFRLPALKRIESKFTVRSRDTSGAIWNEILEGTNLEVT